MVPSRLVKTKEQAQLWAKEQQVTLLDEIVDSTTPVRFLINSGEYAGLVGAKIASLMKPSGYGINWRCLTKASKSDYICNKFKAEGFTILALPISLGTDSRMVARRDLDGIEWNTSLANFRGGNRPPTSAKTSLGEQTIETILKFNNVTYKKEYPVKINGHHYRFDFYLPNYNVYIEYHGEQHYRESGMMSSGVPFKERQKLDKLKKRYAEQRGTYTEIPYTVTAISEITEILSCTTPMQVPTKEYVRGYKDGLISRDTEIAEYYLNHTDKETKEKFGVASNTVKRAFKRIYGTDRTSYRRLGTDQEIAEYALTHTLEETKEKFKTSSTKITQVLIATYGCTKSEYLAKQQQLAVDYYKDHSRAETCKKFNISSGKLCVLWKERYGTSKTSVLNSNKHGEMCKYYLTHSAKETASAFGFVNTTYVCNVFHKVTHTTKKNYLQEKEGQ